MNKKTIFFGILGLVILSGLIFYFFSSNREDPSFNINPIQKTECLVFQSQYPERDCFRIETSAEVIRVPQEKVSYPCDATNAIEAEDCVIKEVQKNNAVDKCALLQGVAKEKCLGITKEITVVDTSIITTKKPLTESLFTVSTTTPVTPAFKNNPISSVVNTITDSIDPKLSFDGFLARLKDSYPVRLYSFSEYQVAPGTEVQAYGMNFDKTDNTLVIGGSRVTGLSSTDGFSLLFKVPSLSNGTYEAYVENKNGTSQNGQKVSLVITTSPAPRPFIQSASPSPALPTDTITLSGQNLLSGSNLVTTLGALSSVSADGTSIRFNIGDLEKTKELVASGQLKGQIFPLMIYVQNSNGVNKDYFVLNVQF